LVEDSGYFDAIITDDRPKLWQLTRWRRLAIRLRGANFHRVYDLQRSQRSSMLYHLVTAGRDTEWCGVTRGCSHYVHDDRNDGRHILDKFDQQLRAGGLPGLMPADLSWLTGEVSRFGLSRPYALLVPGSAAHRPEKRAPAAVYAGLARHLAALGVAPVLIGTAKEKCQIDAVHAACSEAVNLCDQTSFGDLAELARGAEGAIGNDTGAIHLIAAVGCRSLVLFSDASDPRIVAPRGDGVGILSRDSLAALPVEEAIAAWEAMIH
jgi:ADP-heptose:LPS heptosyltransferase